MVEDWRDELERWLAPFVAALKHKTRGRMCPAYIVGTDWTRRSQERPADGGTGRRRQL